LAESVRPHYLPLAGATRSLSVSYYSALPQFVNASLAISTSTVGLTSDKLARHIAVLPLQKITHLPFLSSPCKAH